MEMPISAPRPKLPAIGEARARVGVDRRRIDLAQEAVACVRVLGDDTLRVTGSIAIHVRNGIVQTIHRVHADIEREVLASPILVRCIDEGAEDVGVARSLSGNGVSVNSDARGGELGEHAGQERVRHSLVHEQGLAGVAHAHALRLGIHHNGSRLGEVGTRVHVRMAIPRARLDDRHQALAHAALDKACASARNEHINNAPQAHERSGGCTVGGLDNGYAGAVESVRLNGIRKI